MSTCKECHRQHDHAKDCSVAEKQWVLDYLERVYALKRKKPSEDDDSPL